jgi:NAD(P)-dependent dehydrogenase (short-subunit alcohol dehydrogenase family)
VDVEKGEDKIVPDPNAKPSSWSLIMSNTKRIVLVTGGMGGLGEAICKKMAAMGNTVIVTYSPSNTKSKDWLAEMKAEGLTFHAYPVDVTNAEDCATKCTEIAAKHGPIDVLVNNAGITRDTTFKKMSKVDWDMVMSTRLGPRHQHFIGQWSEGRVRPDQLFGGEGWHARLHQGAGP